jgi:hypothetical protein
LHVLVGPPGAGPPEIGFGGIEYLTMHAWAPTGVLYGFAGTLELGQDETTVPTGSVLLCSRTAACRLTAAFSIDNASQSLNMSAKNATSVVTNAGQLVPSAWTQDAQEFVPVFGFIFTLFVITPLTAAIGVLTDALKEWSPRLRRNRRARKVPTPRRMRDAP